MSDTPETDEAQIGPGRVSVKFARILERQRNAAVAQLSVAWESSLRHEWANFKLRKELAAARDKIKNKTDRIWNLKVALQVAVAATKREGAK